MADETLIIGIVEGTAGEVVGGWAQLSKRPRRTAGGEVRVRTADGRVVEVVLGDARIDPIERQEAEWRTLEQDPAARLCVDDAPAPDAEVELRGALVRGGDRIAAWGEVAETALVQAGGFRDGAERAVQRLRAIAVAIGPDAESRIEALKAEQARRQAQSTKDKARAAAAAAPKPAAPSGPAIHDRTAANWGLLCVGIGAVLGGVWCAFAPPYWIVPAVVSMCVLLSWPVVFDALLLPPFRALPATPRRSLEIPGVAFIIIGSLAIMCAYGSGDLHDEKPERARAVYFVSFGLAGAAFLAAAICVYGTRARRRMLRLLAEAPPHPQPLTDGVWGATDGRFLAADGAPSVGSTEVAIASGERIQFLGTYSRLPSSNAKVQDSSSSALDGFAPEVDVQSPDGPRVRVELQGARWFSTTRLTQATSETRVENADVVAFRSPVRVVGRARDGVLRVGGAESLLVFASTGEIPHGLARARRREHLALGLAALGVVGWAAALVTAIST